MNVYTIDLKFGYRLNTIACYLIEDQNELALIETGPSSTLPNCLDALTKLGIKPADIQHVFLTHIHFDHAGAAGWWASQGAQIYVHQRGAKHMIDPSRLVASATQLYGAEMDVLWGALLPIPAEQVTILEDNDRVQVGSMTIEAWDTPGHASHHHSYIVDGIGFTGDASGVRLPNTNFIALNGAPPQFNPHTYDATITRLANANLDRLFPTHFGEVTGNIQDHFARYRDVVWGSTELVRSLMRNGLTDEAIRRAYLQYNHERMVREDGTDAHWNQHDTANGFLMSADGVILYWKRWLKKQAVSV